MSSGKSKPPTPAASSMGNPKKPKKYTSPSIDSLQVADSISNDFVDLVFKELQNKALNALLPSFCISSSLKNCEVSALFQAKNADTRADDRLFKGRFADEDAEEPTPATNETQDYSENFK